MAESVGFLQNLLQAKLTAICNCARYARDLGFLNLIIESDFSFAIAALSRSSFFFNEKE